MFSFFKDLFAEKKKKCSVIDFSKYISLDIQIETLDRIGLSTRKKPVIDFLLSELDRTFYESNPYRSILYRYADLHEQADGEWEHNSDDIFMFDTECIEGEGSYVSILEKFKNIAGDSFDIINIKDLVDFDSDTAWVSFELNETTYKWDIEIEDDWFDVTLINKINNLLIDSGNSGKFYTYSLDQTMLVVFLDKNKVKELNDVTGYNFK
ncbi:MAG: hypothetical protein PHR06_12140 [Candidatus Cloacimonetes bacterium]|nr:hypothetical protein [Candidatus Cloacimonadota bacterium]